MFSFFKKKELISSNEIIKKEENFTDIMPLAKYFHIETGITFESQLSILKSKVSSFCRQKGFYSFEALVQSVKIDQSLKQELIDHLTTNETYFYRELKQIMDLVQLVKSTHSNFTILCAPSATGEEPYSIAIALLEAGIEASRFKILGIDINSEAIQKSQDAVYKERNLRNLSNDIVCKYFTQEQKHYTLQESVKSLVTFKVINLFDDSLTNIGKFDFVFSRNMLIYFDAKTKLKAKKILEDLRKNDIHNVFFGHADLF